MNYQLVYPRYEDLEAHGLTSDACAGSESIPASKTSWLSFPRRL